MNLRLVFSSEFLLQMIWVIFPWLDIQKMTNMI